MINTELYYDFRLIEVEDYSEQILFYEKYRDLFDGAFEGITSRREFIRRIYILYTCGVAYSRNHDFEKAISLFDIVNGNIQENAKTLNIDLKREYYFVDSLFEKGKALYNLKKYNLSEKTFKLIMDTGFANYRHSNWYSYSRNARLFTNLNSWIFYLMVFLLILQTVVFSFSRSAKISIAIFNLILLVIYLLNPSKRLAHYFTKKNVEKFNLQLDERCDSKDYYSEKIKQNSEDYVSLVERGILYNFEDDFENSIKDLDAALEINPRNSDALYYRAIALSHLGRNEDAIIDYNTLLELNEKDNAEIFNNRGDTYQQLKNFKSALDDFNKAIEFEPFYASFRFNRAYLLQEIGKFKEAIEDYDLVIKLEPENFIAITNRGEAHLALGDKDKALKDFFRAKDFDYKEAIENLEKLI